MDKLQSVIKALSTLTAVEVEELTDKELFINRKAARRFDREVIRVKAIDSEPVDLDTATEGVNKVVFTVGPEFYSYNSPRSKRGEKRVHKIGRPVEPVKLWLREVFPRLLALPFVESCLITYNPNKRYANGSMFRSVMVYFDRRLVKVGR